MNDEQAQELAEKEAEYQKNRPVTIDEAPEHPQMQARDVYSMFDGLRHPSPAPRFSRTPSELRRPAPAPGRDSHRALADWGLPADQIAALEATGAMVQA